MILRKEILMYSNLLNNEAFNKLPDEVKEKLKNCKNEEEAMDILKDNMIEIPSDELKKVAGGSCWTENCYTYGRPDLG